MAIGSKHGARMFFDNITGIKNAYESALMQIIPRSAASRTLYKMGSGMAF